MIKLHNMPVEAMAKKISGLKREVKRAKLFEIQRLVRRIRQLANKKGTEAQLQKNQRKLERFKKELEFLKDAEVVEIVRRITNKDGQDEQHVDQGIEDGVEDSHSDIDLKKRALDKIINSAKLKKFLERVSASKEEVTQAEKRSSDVDTPRLKKKQRKTVVKQKATTTKHKPQPKEDDKEDRSSDLEVPTPQKQQKAAKGKAMTSNSPVSDIKPEQEDEDYAFLPSSEFSDSDVEEDVDDISSPKLKCRGLESCFVQTMSGLNEEKTFKAKSKPGKEKGKEVNKKGKKNRKGQRARQQMWEKVHGKSAKHLRTSKTELSSKESREPKKQQNIKTQHSCKQKSDNETLHPSWEATKRRRLQETMKVEFKGQRIKFDDSE